MQTATITGKSISITNQPSSAALHDKIYELSKNFYDFVQSECNMTADKYVLYLKYTENYLLRKCKQC